MTAKIQFSQLIRCKFCLTLISLGKVTGFSILVWYLCANLSSKVCRMAEAKERNMTPTIPSDMQSVLKRCDTLEKEVRSLKLNLSFMNR